ncbi:Ppx/GppA phosphatase family protein [Kibdelosporangium persicum]|uniref:Exopolyphosphatase / guanosine-5'-triphosphate,3'-diphosphate pyrophosphatase n=1 Tax=Kibdelosporangium persicum TaxID=2698649 RepID=A0ABX2F3H3_9PSEU|nr:exopolyphosphatase [Kibdelosporangium persicum]NRN65521.1 Exopolyphosphatase / guanosine-5'-triphosphate,3'-diphosphate pyrophosphatase [Kibdelosporangium persicum]
MRKERHRVAVLDVGCFSAHLVVAQRDRSSPFRSVVSKKVRLRLDRAIDDSGRISPAGIEQVADAVRKVRRHLQDVPVSAFVPFATSSVRDAANADEVIDRVVRRTGVELQVLPGEREAHLSYIAARHWFGPSAGTLTVLDVGGGTVELAVGRDEQPLLTRSLPLGARTLTRLGLDSDERLPELWEEVADRVAEALSRQEIAEAMRGRAVGCSKVFQQLARLAGARRHHVVTRQDLMEWIPRLAALPAHRRAKLPGISRHRAHQSVAGAVVAESLMRATGHDVVGICPWSTKEGLLIDLLMNTDRAATRFAA